MFKVGNKVVCVNTGGNVFISLDTEYTVLNYWPDLKLVTIKNNDGNTHSYPFRLFKLKETKPMVKFIQGKKYWFENEYTHYECIFVFNDGNSAVFKNKSGLEFVSTNREADWKVYDPPIVQEFLIRQLNKSKEMHVERKGLLDLYSGDKKKDFYDAHLNNAKGFLYVSYDSDGEILDVKFEKERRNDTR